MKHHPYLNQSFRWNEAGDGFLTLPVFSLGGRKPLAQVEN